MMAFAYLSASFLRLGRRKKENVQNYKKVFFIVIFSWEKFGKYIGGRTWLLVMTGKLKILDFFNNSCGCEVGGFFPPLMFQLPSPFLFKIGE
jgi:hypothetical protein